MLAMVGDASRYDILAAHRAGMRAILVDRGDNAPWQTIPDELKNDPHIWPEGTYKGKRVEAKDMTPEQVEAYYAGYQYNEEFGGKKDWG